MKYSIIVLFWQWSLYVVTNALGNPLTDMLPTCNEPK